ncbi:hypothetical protein EMIT0324P_20499 [Pseudomonas chlororaphis]
MKFRVGALRFRPGPSRKSLVKKFQALRRPRSAGLSTKVYPDKNTRTLSGTPIGVNCAHACEEFP